MKQLNIKLCKRCQEEGEKSQIIQGDSTTTLMAIQPDYWDEDGAYHPLVDPNITKTEYYCTRGHNWEE